jgi:Uma2 family endonuclease
VQKRYLYERTGAQECWIVDRFVRRVEVWRFTGDYPTSVSYSDGNTLTTTLLPDLAILIHEIWP